MDSGQWLPDRGKQTVGSGHWTLGSGQKQWAGGRKQWSVMGNFIFFISQNLAEISRNFDLVKNVEFHEIKIMKWDSSAELTKNQKAVIPLVSIALCSLSTFHCPLPAPCLLLTAHCSLSTAQCPLSTVHYLLPTVHCQLLTLPPVLCLLPTPLCMLYIRCIFGSIGFSTRRLLVKKFWFAQWTQILWVQLIGSGQ